MTITNVNFDTISQDSSAMATLEQDIQNVFLQRLPSRYTKSNVRVRFRKGSVIANVTIDVEAEDDSDALTTTLINAKSDCEKEVREKAKTGPAKNFLESGKTVDDIRCSASTPRKRSKNKSQTSAADRIPLFMGVFGGLMIASLA
jgi:hypothetical protein